MPPNTSARPHVLCANCKSFWGRTTCLSFTFEELSGGGEEVPSMPQHLLHSHHRAEIKFAALSGCHFCSIILGSVTGCTGDHADLKFFNHDSPVYISIDILNHDEGTFLMTLFPCEQSRIFSHDMVLNSFPLRLCPIKDEIENTATSKHQLAQVQTSTYSKATADFIKSWILECQTSHPLCGDDYLSLLHGPSQPPPRPRRLLDLQAFQSPDRIRLIEAENEPDLDYCALSYSWGSSKRYVMTSSNVFDFHKEIHLTNLPKTFRDAIQVARGLGFRHLWIDALCIMQDGDSSRVASDDWLDQAGKMHDIFGKSVVTIAASESFDCNQGFISPRNALGQAICRLDLDTKLYYEIVPPSTPYCLLHPFDNARYHVDTRGWVFQERILSPRTLHFTRNFVHLECRTELRCEATSRPDACHHSGAVAKAVYQTLFSMFGLGGLGGFAVEGFLNHWHQLIRGYSTTNLTQGSDLLVALAGLAKKLQKQTPLTWTFGLWREHILRDMLWYVRGGRGVPFRERAPTWSWASIEVRGPQIMYEASAYVSLVAKITALPETSSFTQQFSLPADESRYCVKVLGQLRYGAPYSAKPGTNDPSSMASSTKHEIRIHRNCQGMRELHPECPFHADCKLTENVELYSLLVARGSGTQPRTDTFQDWNTEMGLVLTPVAGHQQRYRRVGYFHHSMQHEMDSGLAQRLPSLFNDDFKTQEIEIV